ncbi:MAG: preprotein translocase subunit SecE [Lachnospiraceae bacterium]|nr:preprotein translocase subunit SecE [Lachnospiraceae bacterium]MBR6537006.1 preprotein translocase subunit SecE [Lachnospiraceae bacterium]
MGETTANTTQEKAPKKSWFKGLKSEFKKITWPDKDTLVKESAAVIVITVVLGFVIALVDMAVNSGVDLIL